MRALHPVVKSAVALLLFALAMEAVAAQAPAGKIADTQASSKLQRRRLLKNSKLPSRHWLRKRNRCTFRSAGRLFSTPSPACAGSWSVTRPFWIRSRSARLRWSLLRRRRAAAALCYGMKGRTPAFWMSMRMWMSRACAMEFGRRTPANQCRLRLSREECWSPEKSDSKADGGRYSADGKCLFQGHCQLADGRTRRTKSRSCSRCSLPKWTGQSSNSSASIF